MGCDDLSPWHWLLVAEIGVKARPHIQPNVVFSNFFLLSQQHFMGILFVLKQLIFSNRRTVFPKQLFLFDIDMSLFSVA